MGNKAFFCVLHTYANLASTQGLASRYELGSAVPAGHHVSWRRKYRWRENLSCSGGQDLSLRGSHVNSVISVAGAVAFTSVHESGAS